MSANAKTAICASANLDAMSHATAYQKAIQRLVAEHLPLARATPGKDYFIDFGAGKGEYAQALKSQTGAEVVCIEPDVSLHAHYPPDLPRSADLWRLSCGAAARGSSLGWRRSRRQQSCWRAGARSLQGAPSTEGDAARPQGAAVEEAPCNRPAAIAASGCVPLPSAGSPSQQLCAPAVLRLSRGEPLPAAGAYSLNVFEHITTDVTALNELVSCLRPGGLVFILVPADPLLWTAMDDAVGHARRYTSTRLRALAILAGLKVEAEGWFDRTGYLATRVQQAWTNRARAPEWDGRISAWQVRLFDWAFRILEPGLARLELDFGKNRWVLARVPENWKN